MITINSLTKTFENGECELYALNNVSLEIGENEFVVILGPSGSGKSTLLNAISGLIKPNNGSIKYDDIDICGLNDKELTKFRRDTTAFIFQAYYLLPSLTVEANIKMGADLAKNKEYKSIIEALGLKGKEKKLPHQLSGGEQQRVSIARAISKNPKVLFCDEPTGALDEKTGKQILNYLIRLQKEKKLCIIMTTHNSNIAKLATQTVRMNSGKIVEIITNENPASVDEIGW